jgi:hypothetical protein
MGTINDMIRKLEKFHKEIENLSGKSFLITPDSNGMIDRQCPKDVCLSIFKVHADDWKNIFKDEEVFCPFCRNNSEAQEYLPREQRSKLIGSIEQAIMDNWNYKKSISEKILSIESSQEFELLIKCKHCNARYSVIGAAYFCPCCGSNTIENNAKRLIENLVSRVDKIDDIQKALEQILTKDESAMISKSILENSLTNCLSIMQFFSEFKYNQLSQKVAPFNAFQNIEKANKLWMDLFGQGYVTRLSESERIDFEEYTQKRHLIEHKGGIIDSKYLEITRNSKVSMGDRILVNPKDIIELGCIIVKIIDSINNL